MVVQIVLDFTPMMPSLRLLINRFSFLLALIKRQPAAYCPKVLFNRQWQGESNKKQRKRTKKDNNALLALTYGGSRAAIKIIDKSSKRLKIP
jgi:hypothetical protein